MAKTIAQNHINKNRLLKNLSFRTLIIVTIFIVVGAISFVSHYVFSKYMQSELADHAKEDISSVLTILQDHYMHTAADSGGQILHPVLEDLSVNEHLRNTMLINEDDTLIYFSKAKTGYETNYHIPKISELKKDITLKEITDNDSIYLRAYIRLNNSPKCYACHAADKQYLGMIVFDISLTDSIENIVAIRNFSIIYSALIVIIILISVFVLHYRIVKKSLSNIHETIDKINDGNLSDRLEIPKSKEFGNLSLSFNTMVDSFQSAQNQLKFYHEEEIKNKLRLATIGEMASRVAHEIRNPITGIANATEILIDKMQNDENKVIMEEIQRQAERVNTAITNMFRYANTDSALTIEKRNINEIINSVIFFIKNQVKQKKIEFNFLLQKDIPLISLDHELIEIVLSNLILNAIKSIKESGSILISTNYSVTDETVTISIKDTGSGISSKIINDIFTPFFTSSTEGTGLGLAISKEIIEKHKGKIWVESAVNMGSQFYISLPIDQ